MPPPMNFPMMNPMVITNEPGSSELEDMFQYHMSDEWHIPIQCEKLTQLISLVLLEKIRERTAELADKIWTETKIVRRILRWDQQIEEAVRMDPDEPNFEEMIKNQEKFLYKLGDVHSKAIKNFKHL